MFSKCTLIEFLLLHLDLSSAAQSVSFVWTVFNVICCFMAFISLFELMHTLNKFFQHNKQVMPPAQGVV